MPFNQDAETWSQVGVREYHLAVGFSYRVELFISTPNGHSHFARYYRHSTGGTSGEWMEFDGGHLNPDQTSDSAWSQAESLLGLAYSRDRRNSD